MKKFKNGRAFIFTILLASLLGCSQPPSPQAPSDATSFTKAANQTIAERLPLTDQQDFIEANRGLVARYENAVIYNSQGEKIWSVDDYDFIQGDAPDTVNPSLWRQEKLNRIAGLFKVTEGVYQLRGFDLANMTLIKGQSGWIIIDPLTASETAAAALQFAQQHLGDIDVTAVLYTHAHMDHFGGVLGVLDAEQQAINPIPIYAPAGFMDAATSENIIAGVAMGRRSMLMYGKNLPKGPDAHIGSGLGKMPAYGTFGILAPTDTISTTGETRTIDGIDFVFQNAPGSESPAEMTFYIPQFKLFMGAELVSRNLHNLYTLRGAQVRNALVWSGYIDEAIEMFVEDSEIYIGSHHWPIWGQEGIKQFLVNQRDLYKFIHDQTVRLMNQGYTPDEIADTLELPESLDTFLSNRGYYGTVKHNAKAVYQYYMGWYDANPANLNPLPKSQSASRYIALMGGADAVIQAASEAFNSGEYEWAAELLNKVVFSQPSNVKARQDLAKTYQQMGYQAESGPWRNVYLTGAMELLQGSPESGVDIQSFREILLRTPVSKFFESMAVRIDSEAAEESPLIIRINFTDLDERYDLEISNGVLHHRLASAETVNAELVLTQPLFVGMIGGSLGIKDTLFSDDFTVNGSTLDLVRFFALFDKPDGLFNIVEP